MNCLLPRRTLHVALAALLIVSGRLDARELPVDRRLQLALAAVEDRRWDDAASELEQVRGAAQSDRQKDEATFWLAYTKYRAGETDKAEALARELAEGSPGHAWSGPAALLLDAIGRGADVTVPGAAAGMTRSVRTQRAGTDLSTPSGAPSADDWLGGGVSLLIPVERGRQAGVLATIGGEPSSGTTAAAAGILQGRDQPALLVDLLAAPSPALRAAALEVLLLLGQTPDTSTVVGVYLGADREARIRIIEALAAARAAEPLREIVRRENDERLNQAATTRLQALH